MGLCRGFPGKQPGTCLTFISPRGNLARSPAEEVSCSDRLPAGTPLGNSHIPHPALALSSWSPRAEGVGMGLGGLGGPP